MAKAKAKPARRGRPPLAETEGRRSVLNARVTRETRRRLEETAAGSGRSLSQEIEIRLEQSFSEEEARYKEFGGKPYYELARMLAWTTSLVETVTGKTWRQDVETRHEVETAISRFFGRFGAAEPPSSIPLVAAPPLLSRPQEAADQIFDIIDKYGAGPMKEKAP